MKKPSASLAVSTLALAVALTGTAGAAGGWINGSRIKPHSITAKQIKTHAITKQALADGVIVNNTVIAPTGPQGVPGDPGTPGPAAVVAFNPAKLIVVNGADIMVASGSRGDAQAECPAGTYVVGGGYSEMQAGGNVDVKPTASQPLGNVGAGLQGWDVVARNLGGSSQTVGWHAIAYCAPAA